MSSKTARAVKQFFAGYHEPQRLSQGSSQKLLDGLKSSFRKQLDQEFGPDVNRTAGSAHSPESDSKARDSASMQHLQAILSNPLFRQTSPHVSKQKTGTSKSLLELRRDSMDDFDQAVARGMMTLPIATGCMMASMMAKKDQRLLAAGIDLGASDTASRVVQWLRLSGTEKQLDFLDDTKFIAALTPFLVAEGLDDVAWKWILRLVKGPQADHKVSLRRASSVLLQLVHARSRDQNMTAAMSTILQAEHLLQHNPHLPYLLLRPWRLVSWLSTVKSVDTSAPQEQLFDAHLATADLLTRPVPVETAHLHLYHPSQPNPQLALELLNNREAVDNIVSPARASALAGKSNRLNMITWIEFLVRDTAAYLDKKGLKRDATNLLRNYERQSGPSHPDTFHPA